MPQDATRRRILAAAPLAAVLIANGVALLVIGLLFAAWPASLGESDFASEPSLLGRVVFLLIGGGSGFLLLLMGHGLLKSWPFAWRRFTHTATVIAITAISIMWRSPGYRLLAGAALVASLISLVLYLRIRSELPDHLQSRD